MLEDKQSKLKLYSLGIVIKDKQRGSDLISVLPIEELPMSDGLIKDAKKEFKAKGVDSKSVSKISSVEGNLELIAKWIPFGHSNRISSPDVIKNETVILFRFADTEEYYWTTIFREPSLRRLETVLYAFGNLSKGMIPFDKDSSYWLEVSTHDKYVKLHTSKSDGEPYEYDVIINTDTGSIELKDDIGNVIRLTSKEHRIELLNASGSHYDMVGPDLDITIPNNIRFRSSNFNIDASNIAFNGNNIVVAGGSGINITSPDTNVE